MAFFILSKNKFNNLSYILYVKLYGFELKRLKEINIKQMMTDPFLNGDDSDDVEITIKDETFEDQTHNEISNDVDSVLNKADIQQFFDFILGNVDKTPDKINKLMNNLTIKMQMVIGANIVRDFNRGVYLTDYMAEAEKQLFNKNNLVNMDAEEVQMHYNEARKTLSIMQDNQRKFIQANKEGVKVEMTEAELLMSKLLTLSPDKMSKILELVNQV